jgi:hypothetical protein
LEALRERIEADPELALRLRRIEPARFAGEVVSVAYEIGCDVDAADLGDAIAAGQRAWTMRWLR